MSKDKAVAPFMLDDRSIGARLDAFRAYCQRMPFEDKGTWAQVLLGRDAGRWNETWTPDNKDFKLVELAWASQQQYLAERYEAPGKADGKLPPEQVFLLALMGILETPRALLNRLPTQHRDLYYLQMLALSPRLAQSDRVTVRFTLADGARERVLPAGLRLDAGEDGAGTPVQYALERPLTVNAARLTDVRWVVHDSLQPGGRRARVLLDESAGVAWPSGGVRLFEASPAKPGEAARLDADRAVTSGRIVGSPVLAVAGGERTWTVKFDKAPTGRILAELSIGKTWVKVDCTATNAPDEWTVTLGAEAGAPAVPTDLDGIVAATPLLRLTSESGEPVPAVTQLKVAVTGAVNVHCASDDGTALTGGGLPFGEVADAGRGVNLMSAEWWRLGPKLTNVTVTPTWVSLPTKSLTKWYGPDQSQQGETWFKVDKNLNVDLAQGQSLKNWGQQPWPPESLAALVKKEHVDAIETLIKPDPGYPACPTANADFKVKASIVRHDKQSAKSLGSELSLFAGDEAPTPNHLAISLSSNDLPTVDTDMPAPEDDDPAAWPWRVRLDLTRSFLQAQYDAHLNAPAQTVVFTATQTLKMQSVALEKDGGPKLVERSVNGTKVSVPVMQDEPQTYEMPVPVTVPKAVWNAPYVPQWSGVRVDYEAADEHVTQCVMTPFGYAPQDERFTHPAAEAELYLGIDGIEANQRLTLHWQLKSPAALALEWQYLAPGERWCRLPVTDETEQLSTSGGWSADWPGDASRTATSLPAGRMWLRGRLQRLPARDRLAPWLPTCPWLTGLVTNAAPAALVAPQKLGLAHFALGLPAGRVTQALNTPGDIQQVEQPWPSWGGRAAETRAAFEARVARRLRHRDRGLNNVDLMNLLQEQYPGIRELTVLPPGRDERGTLSQKVAVMPGRAMSDSEDVRRPGLSSAHLKEMKAWLSARVSPWLTLDCVNPDYVTVNVSWDVEYQTGLSRTIGDARVKAALQAAFAPWAGNLDDIRVQAIGRRITHGAVLDVLRTVAEVADVKAVSLNGDPDEDPLIEAGQVAVLACVPREYDRLTLAWVGAQSEPDLRYNEVTVTCGDPYGVRLCATVPQTVVGLGPDPIDAKEAPVYLVDLDTGKRLPEKGRSDTGLWARKRDDHSPLVPNMNQFAGPCGAVPRGGVTIYWFDVGTDVGAHGVHRIGVAVELKVNGVPDATLESARIGQIATINVQAKALNDLTLKSGWELVTDTIPLSAKLPEGVDCSVTRYVLQPKPPVSEGLTVTLTCLNSNQVDSKTVKKATGTNGSNDETGKEGLRTLDNAPVQSIKGRESEAAIHVWWCNPNPGKVGFDKLSTIGEINFDEAVTFEAVAPQSNQVALYAMKFVTQRRPNANEQWNIGRYCDDYVKGLAVEVSGLLGKRVIALTFDGFDEKSASLSTIGSDLSVPSRWQVDKQPTPVTPTGAPAADVKVTCSVFKMSLEKAVADRYTAIPLEIKAETASYTVDTVKENGNGLVLSDNSPVPHSMARGKNFYRLWFVNPPAGPFGLKAGSTIGKVSVGTTDLTFSAVPPASNTVMIYRVDIQTDQPVLDDKKIGELTTAAPPSHDVTVTVTPQGLSPAMFKIQGLSASQDPSAATFKEKQG